MSPYSITRESAVADAMAVQEAINLCAANGDGQSALANHLRELRDSIEEQVKPAIEEPTEFGSVVRARGLYGSLQPLLWQKCPMKGKHYWESETGAVEVWSELADVAVLRVGVGPEPLAAWETELLNTQYRADIAAQVLEAMDVDQYLIDAVRNAKPGVQP